MPSPLPTFFKNTFKFQIITTAPNETFTLPINIGGAGYVQNFNVNWGDNSFSKITAYDDADRVHIYVLAGTYNIVLSGTCEWFAFNNAGDCTKIKKLLSFTGNMGFKVLNFYGCTNLNAICALGKFSALTTAFNMFRNCTSLTSLPVGLFDKCTAINTFAHTFHYMGLIGAIPTDLFKYNTLVTSFDGTFYFSQAITSIPADLFRYNPLVTTFYTIFHNCAGIIVIPTDLFRYNTLVTQFNKSFTYCYGLTTIPANLFKYNILSTDFGYVFYDCIKAQHNINIFYADGEQDIRFLNQSVNFYECFRRSSFSGVQGVAPDLWNCDFGTGTPNKFQCYYGAGNSLTSLSNYNDIPVEWK